MLAPGGPHPRLRTCRVRTVVGGLRDVDGGIPSEHVSLEICPHVARSSVSRDREVIDGPGTESVGKATAEPDEMAARSQWCQ